MSRRTYHMFNREEFEKELNTIADIYSLKFREINPPHELEELKYEMTTRNPAVRMVIYSSLSRYAEEARDCGKDAVRISMWAFNKDGEPQYRKFKHCILRIETVFENVERAIGEAQRWVYGSEARQWLYALGFSSLNGYGP
jgi:hypothetical protein